MTADEIKKGESEILKFSANFSASAYRNHRKQDRSRSGNSPWGQCPLLLQARRGTERRLYPRRRDHAQGGT